MKVLFQARPDCLKNPAGDTVQLVYTAQALKKLGVEIDFSADSNALLTSYNLIHIFNLTRIKESYMFFLNAQKQKKKVVISPIYWNPEKYLARKEGKRRDVETWRFYQHMRSRLSSECNLLLPNSESEMENLKKDFPNSAPYEVVPNGFPDSFKNANPELFHESFPNLPQEFVLCVARIAPRKNQHWLARICSELNIPLVLVGPINNKTYYQEVMSHPRAIHLGTLQGELLASAYAAAKLHALPSWFETPGLSSLEAGACGTTVLSTDQGSPKEYFKDMAAYCHPVDDTSLRTSLEKALNLNPAPLTEHIRENYPWSKVGEITLRAYENVLNIAHTARGTFAK